MKSSHLNTDQVQILRSTTNRLWLIVFLEILACMIPFLLPEAAIGDAYKWMMKARIPLIDFYTESFSADYFDWKSRLLSIYTAYACMPVLFFATYKFIESIPKQQVEKKFKVFLLGSIFTLLAVSLFMFAPGKDFTLTRWIPNAFGIKSSIMTVFESLACSMLFAALTSALGTNKGATSPRF